MFDLYDSVQFKLVLFQYIPEILFKFSNTLYFITCDILCSARNPYVNPWKTLIKTFWQTEKAL